MEGFKEFQGKNLDDAISEACSYFDAPRERLEIDIIQDSKSGIFGIVGARKAKIKARRVQLRDAVDDILGRGAAGATAAEGISAARESHPRERRNERKAAAGTVQERKRPPRQPPASPEKPAGDVPPCDAGRAEDASAPAEQKESGRTEGKPLDEDAGGRGARPRRRSVRNRPRGQEEQSVAPASASVLDGDASADEALSEGLAEIPFEEMDQERLSALSLEAVERLVTPIVGGIPLKVELEEGRVNVVMDCGEDSGLLIGREGQTLASLQYLASRIVSRGMGASVRVQLDAGEYRLRQDEKLREMALALAEKVRATGKSHSTRPLSSYHRRIIHMTLQDAPDVQTRSSGDGPLKRVVIQRKKG